MENVVKYSSITQRKYKCNRHQVPKCTEKLKHAHLSETLKYQGSEAIYADIGLPMPSV